MLVREPFAAGSKLVLRFINNLNKLLASYIVGPILYGGGIP